MGTRDRLKRYFFFIVFRRRPWDVLLGIGGTAQLAETWRPSDWRRRRVRDVTDQRQDPRVHVERRRTTADGGGGGGGGCGGRVVVVVVVHSDGQRDNGGVRGDGQRDACVQERHVRPANRELAGPVVAREPQRRSRRGRGHCQKQVYVFFRLCRRRQRGRPLRSVHDHQRARRQLPYGRRRWPAAATQVLQTVSPDRPPLN